MTPSQRLAASRQAIVDQLHRKDRRHDRNAVGKPQVPGQPAASGHDWLGYGKDALQSWWQHHPASMAFELVQPALGSLASSNPWRLLVIAAALGAVAVALRPWRLLTLSGLLFAGLRASNLPRLLFSLATGSRRRAPRSRR